MHMYAVDSTGGMTLPFQVEVIASGSFLF